MRLLVIAPYYHTFIKGLVEAEANYLEGVDDLSQSVSRTHKIPSGF
jgi:hypothetical protein